MPTPTKFTDPVRRKILGALQLGASRPTAAAIGGVSDETLRRWLERGKRMDEDSASGFRKFYDAVHEAEAYPKVRALQVVNKAWEDKPDLAWKFIERREHGFAPPVPQAAAPAMGPVVIQLSLADGRPLELSDTVIEVGAVEQDEAAGSTGDPAPLASA